MNPRLIPLFLLLLGQGEGGEMAGEGVQMPGSAEVQAKAIFNAGAATGLAWSSGAAKAKVSEQ